MAKYDCFACFHHIPLPVWVVNTAKRFVFVNEAAERMYGYSCGEFINLNLDDIAVDEQDARKYEEIFRKSLEVGKGSRFRQKHKTKYGNILDVDVEWNVIRIKGVNHTLSVIKDVTIYNTLDQTFWESNGKCYNCNLTEFIISKGDIRYLLLDNNFHITYVTPGIRINHKDIALDTDFFTLFKSSMENDSRLLHIKYLDQKNSSLVIENFIHKNREDPSEEQIFTFKAYYLNGNKKHNKKILILFEDNTKIYSQSKSLKYLQDFLTSKDRIIALGESIAGIAHEINNPLTTIMTNIELINSQEGHLGPELERIYQEALRTGKIINNLLAFTHQKTNLKKAVNIGESITNTLPYLKLKLSGINLTLSLEEGIYTFGDPIEFSQVILNLISNSIDALENSREKKVSIEASIQNSSVQIIISDTGCGIDEENLEKIFQPFFTTKEVGKGTGLGLSIVYSLINNMGGNIVVSSKLGTGSTFTINLPNYESPKTCDINTIPRYLIDKKILIIDDDYLLLESIKQLLEKHSNKVTAVHDSLMGLRLLMTEEYDLILLDIQMPVANGLEIYRTLFESGYDVDKIILMGGYIFSQQVTELIEKYNCNIIQKPFTLHSLEDYIRTIRISGTLDEER